MTEFVSENVCLQDKVPPSSTETDVSNPEDEFDDHSSDTSSNSYSPHQTIRIK